MQSSHLIAYTPPGFADPALAIAACRAGARGILDLEYTQDVAAALAALNELAHFTTTAFGIKLGPRSCELAAQLSSATNPRLRWIVLAGGAHQDLAGWVKQFQQQGKQVYLEAVSLEEARLGESLGVDGLILKGHEAGGRVGAETSFVLLQRWQAHKIKHSTTLPVWIQGGVGLHTVAACVVGGAAGVVLDAQLLLTRESPLDHESRQRLLAFDGSETLCLGERLGASYRCFHRPRWGAGDEMIQEEERIAAAELSDAEKKEAWCTAVAKLVGNSPDRHLWLIGQDAAFARSLAERHGTVAGVIQALVEQGQRQLKTARRLQPLAEGAPLAVRHKTRYPIVQGPMTRVSDTAAFAESVAAAGGLPFLALALMRQNEATKLLQEAKTRLQGKSWGVGILGFVPPEIRSEQLTAIRQYPPPFALIAGGQPAQARELENEGITTYLHVPSPGLLKMFLKEGARRFVFEGRECGGHVGPRTSFVLWETMCQLLLDHLGPHSRGDDLHIIFAGGIHDALSSAMVAALAAPLAERGVAVGVLMGTAYLFTQEAVASGGIVARFQQEALNCGDTVLLQTGPGHAIRCIRTPYQDLFETEKRRLQQEGRSHEEITRTLEWMNIGRLRIASKGIDRARNADSPTKFVTLAADEQHQRGMYMIGQVAALRDRVISMQELHADVSVGGTQFLQSQAEPSLEVVETPKAQPCDVAVIGMACFYPRAADVWSYWENVLSKVDAVTEVPASHWDWRLYYDSNPQAADKIISKWGGFLDDMTFDPMAFGITPKSITAIEPLQLFLLEGVRRALIDAGYDKRPFNRERTATILGIGGGGSPLAVSYGLRTCIPMFDTVPGLAVDADEIFKKTAVMLPEWTEDSFPGILLNVAVGRVANRFDFGGPNYAIDAACGSSLASLQACIRELEVGTSDVAVAMGADTVQTPYAYMAFSKTHALSPKGRCKPFDAAADGIVLSEGIGVVVLKRLADAERDGDKIYAVIKGMGASSDGRDKGLTAPRAKGQLLALRRAYEKAGISPACVELIEAHGTGTVVGDQTEVQALGQVLAESGAEPHSCALGSVKSMIGHSKCAAGIAGFIKTVMAIQHKVLPPTLVEKPNLKYDWEKGPLYLNTEPRPWVHGPESPRVAGVSAFGFGGTNFHVVLEEYTGSYLPPEESAMRHWPAELLLFRKPSRAALLEAVERCHRALVQGAAPQLADLALSLYKDAAADAAAPTLAVVASHVEDVQAKLEQALKTLRSSDKTLHDPRGIYFAEQPAQQSGKVAFLFPGQGSQYPDMLAQTAIAFAEVRQALDRAEDILAGTLEKPLSRFIYPSSAFTPQRQKENQQALTRTDVAQPAIGAVSMGMYQLLSRFGLQPDFLAGHSYGEYVALWAAGVMDEEQLLRLSYQRGKIIREAAGSMPGGMVAVEAEAAAVEGVLGGLADVVIANRNAPAQTVISGTEAALTAALKRCQEQGLRAQRIPVACGFHSPLVESARQPLAQAIVASTFAAPARPVFANSTAQPYPAEPAAIAALLAQHLVSSVHFQAEIEAMYDAGARIFVEVGPHGVLTGLVHQILSKRPHLALSSDVKGRPGLLHLQHLLAQLLVHGVPVQLARLYQGRALKTHNLNRLKEETTPPAPTPTTWLVNSIRSRPWNAPEPRLIGQQRVAASKPTPPAAKPAAKSETPPSTAARPVLAQPVAPVHRPIPENRRSFTSMQPLSTSPATNGVKPAANGVYLPQDEAAQVMLRFQDLMAKFLDTQKAVMTTYLQGGGEPAGLSNGTAHAPLPVQVPPVRSNGSVGHNGNGHSSPAAARGEMVPAPVATPPGREIVVKPESSANGTTASAPVESKKEPEKKQELTVQMDRGWLSNQLLELVGERTGYPREMLGVDMDLEADLGIDSIKRIEILGALAELMGLGTEAGADSGLEMEKLTTIRTLRGILDYLEGTLSEKKKVSQSRSLAER